MNYMNKNSVPQLASKKKCTGCMACISSCPTGALTPYIDDDGHAYVKKDENKCIGCKKCEKICKSSRNFFGNNNLSESKIYAAWANDNKLRKNSTSGGVFAAIAKNIIKNGGVVVGASLDNKECRHIVISKVEDIIKLQGSKYLASSMNGIYKEIEKNISESLVLFSGTGCQCAGVLAYFENSKYKNNLITIDLVCGGYPSKILIDRFYEKNSDIDKIISFRSKDKYLLKVVKDNEKFEIHDKNLPLHGFNCELTNRYSCYNCQFAKAHRKTDITIGDLWNYKLFNNEHSKGISTVIVHSKIGENLLSNSNIRIESINWSDSINYCKRIVCGKTPIFLPRRMLVYNINNMSKNRFEKLYCINMKVTDIDLFFFRAYRFIIVKINKFISMIYIKNLIRKESSINDWKGKK